MILLSTYRITKVLKKTTSYPFYCLGVGDEFTIELRPTYGARRPRVDVTTSDDIVEMYLSACESVVDRAFEVERVER